MQRPLGLLLGAIAAIAVAAPAHATSLDDVRQLVAAAVKPDELAVPGSHARADAINGMLSGGDLGLSPSDTIDLKLDLAEAWLDAVDPAKCEAVVTDVLTANPTQDQRDRAGLAWLGAWKARLRTATDPAAVPTPLSTMAGLGAVGAKVLARAHLDEAYRQGLIAEVAEQAGGDSDADAKAAATAAAARATAIAEDDTAIALLKDQPAEDRVPAFHLRLLAMEANGAKPPEVTAWLAQYASDPAIAEVSDSALTGGQKLVGQKAPAMTGKRIDGKDGDLDLATFAAGKPVMIDFFATWCKPCAAQADAIEAVATRWAGKGLVTVGYSLDTKDTLPHIAQWITDHHVSYPLIGDGNGWDGETHAAWHVEAIPAVILVGADGKVAAVDLTDNDPQATSDKLDAAIATMLGVPAPVGVAPLPAPKPAAPKGDGTDLP